MNAIKMSSAHFCQQQDMSSMRFAKFSYFESVKIHEILIEEILIKQLIFPNITEKVQEKHQLLRESQVVPSDRTILYDGIILCTQKCNNHLVPIKDTCTEEFVKSILLREYFILSIKKKELLIMQSSLLNCNFCKRFGNHDIISNQWISVVPENFGKNEIHNLGRLSY